VPTYTLEDVTSIDAAVTYSDSGLTSAVETLTHGNFTKTATGVYLLDDELTYASYTLGTIYWLKITWTPSGAAQRTDSFPFMVMPQGQAAGAASVTDTDARHGKHLEAPVLLLRVGRGGFRESDFENGVAATRDRFVQQMPLPASTEADDVHLLISSGRAGAPVAIATILAHGQIRDVYADDGGVAPIEIPMPAGFGREGGYRGQAGGSYYLRHSRNITVHPDVHRTRPGFSQRRHRTGETSATYTERIPLDTIGASFNAVLHIATEFYTNAATPAPLSGYGYSSLTDPYADASNRIPQWVHMLGRTLWVNGSDGDYRMLLEVSSVPEAMAELVDPTVALELQVGSGSMTAAVTYVRIRTKESNSGTESGPSNRTTTAATVTTTGANLEIKVTISAQGGRATHWQIQSATVTDTPSGYQIHTSVASESEGADITSGTGWIPIATTVAYIHTDAASADRFEYRTIGGTSVYRHSNIPSNASHICHFMGRSIWATHSETWIVWSEADNPEHFYTDPDAPHTGFNTLDGESLVDAVTSPCMALAATEDRVLFFMRTGIVVMEGTLNLSVASDQTATAGARDVRTAIVAANSLGAISPATHIRDNDVFFFSQKGPAVFTAGRAVELDPEAIRADWENRNPVYDQRGVVGGDPDRDLVLFSFVSKNARSTGVPDVTLAYHIGKQQWCPPWDLDVCSWTLHRDQDDSNNEKGDRTFFGGPFGALNELGVGWGDGEDGSDADAADGTSTSDTTTTLTDSTKSWTDTNNGEWKGMGLVLTDRTTGRRYYRTIKSNTATVLTWEGAVTDAGAGWTYNIGGIRTQVHLNVHSPGKPMGLQRAQVVLQDLLGILT
jgi:hypothetical protein